MDDLEQRLRRQLQEPEPAVPAAVRAAVLADGRAAATGFRKRRRFVRLAGASAAAAAAALLAVTLWLGHGGGPDFDVADAWRVASGLEHDRRFDQNGDGRVDRADADRMLAAIVALPTRRGS
ncbi:MAG: hypothetical protein H6835_03375 [Planctomycetes bacterium]|nr:hypothetical protein [Planctomycetota bacterium]